MEHLEICESHTRRADGTDWFSFVHVRAARSDRFVFLLQRSPERPLTVTHPMGGWVDVMSDASGIRISFHPDGDLIVQPFHLHTTPEERDILLRVFSGEWALPEDGKWVTLADLAARYAPAPAPIDDGEPAEGDVVRHVA